MIPFRDACYRRSITDVNTATSLRIIMAIYYQT